MYCSAIFYYTKNMNDSTLKLLKYNPLYGIITNFRRSLFGLGFDMNLLLYSGAISVVMLLLGIFLFYKKQDDFILNI